MGNWPFPIMVGLDWLFSLIFCLIVKVKGDVKVLVQVVVLGL